MSNSRIIDIALARQEDDALKRAFELAESYRGLDAILKRIEERRYIPEPDIQFPSRPR